MALTFGVIGVGNMGGAILKGALDAGVLRADDVIVYDILPQARAKTADWGVRVADGDDEVAAQADVVLLAVKPQNAQEALAQAGSALAGKALLSIVAGVGSDRLRGWIDGDVRVLRLLPNTPALVFEGAFALSSDNDFAQSERDFATELFKALGVVEFVPEHLLDAVCGLSGGAPAYVAMFIEAMADGGVQQGLPRAVAYRLAAQTCLGTAKLILERGLHPGEAKDMVTSPAGTTIEGVAALERGGFRGAVIDAIIAGAEKSKRL